ncbi:MAG: hypothetical protein Q7W45_05715 [Bacteroidota bacterium]|nr:hypothetical protein [Bacteroidota bacterium]MDP3144943.1 hypothetical protein [Bacteroidota bacterium]
MKKCISIILTVFLVACGAPALKEYQLTELGLSITTPELKKEPKYKTLSFDKMLGKVEITTDKRRFEIVEIEESIYPKNLEDLISAVSGGDNFKGMIKDGKYPEGKISMANGAFGLLYTNKKGNDFLIYYSKGSRYYRCRPILNSELKELDTHLAIIESFK